MMKASPTASFVMAQAEFLLQFLIIPFDDPAMFGQVDEFHYRDIVRKRGESVLGWLRFLRWPFDQQPFFGMRFRSPVVAMRGTHSQRGKAGLQFVLHPCLQVIFFQASMGSNRASSFTETGWLL